MNDMEKEKAAVQQEVFLGYEYKEVTADADRVSFLIDGYECFGWELDERLIGSGNVGNRPGPGKVTVHLKRNRKIINKMELTRLQRNFEACVKEINMLEKAKTSKAIVWALVIALVGTAFMAGATFAVTAPQPHYILTILLAFPGFLGWLFPCFIYRMIVRRQTEKMTPLIETKFDEIYEICEKGNKLLH